MATHIAWKGCSKQLLVLCADCKALLLKVAPGPAGARVMRCFGALIVGSDRLPAVAQLVCGACAVVTAIPRSLVPGSRVPSPLYASLARGETARIVMGAVDEQAAAQNCAPPARADLAWRCA